MAEIFANPLVPLISSFSSVLVSLRTSFRRIPAEYKSGFRGEAFNLRELARPFHELGPRQPSQSAEINFAKIALFSSTLSLSPHIAEFIASNLNEDDELFQNCTLQRGEGRARREDIQRCSLIQNRSAPYIPTKREPFSNEMSISPLTRRVFDRKT